MKQTTYNIITYGCQMNQNDSERISGFLNSENLKLTKFKKADFVILNLCSVRQSAIDRVWGKIIEIKKNNSQAKIILTGCILPEDKKKFAKKVDYILNISELKNWIKKINKKIIKQTDDIKYFSVQPKYNSSHTAFVPIMTGCNNFCSYCAVPYTRGREKSRPIKDIFNEVNKLVVQGYKHIILLGQNVNSYKNNKTNFPKLLKTIDKIHGNYWLSFMTSHPKDMSDELIECFKVCQHLIPYLHLPIQSGSNKILKLMNRKYTVTNYLKLIKKIRKINPDINLSTDIIIGFPKETKKDFNETKKILKSIKYGTVYINKYSPRSGTSAYNLEDNVSYQEKKSREKELTQVLKKTALKNNEKLIGKKVEVLIENKKNNYYYGKTKNFINIKIKTNKNLIGKIIQAKITKAHEWSLEGKII
jgi:tRNA-2-methylthio-N6-dimethylallyladenosine synthase